MFSNTSRLGTLPEEERAISACHKDRQTSNSRLSRPISSAATSNVPVNVVNGNLSMWVSLVRVLLIASWLPSDWRQSQRGDRNGLLVLCGHLPTELLSFHRQNRVVTYRRIATAFPTSIFSHYKWWKSNTGGRSEKYTQWHKCVSHCLKFSEIIQYNLLYSRCYFSHFSLMKAM